MRSADAPTIPSSGALSSMSSVRASHPLSSLVLLANLDVTRPLPRDHAMETTTRTTTAPGVSYNRLRRAARVRSEEHTSELQSRGHLVCRLLLEKKKTYTV